MSLIQLDAVSIRIPVYGLNSRVFKQELVRIATGGLIKTGLHTVMVDALKNINLRLEDGMRLGIIGGNGAGKTTLLRLISGIYEPTSGTRVVQGAITALFDVMVGMEEDLTGLENIVLRGVLLGAKKKEMQERHQEIVNFTGLGDYIHMPIRTYSSGMKMRLAFSILEYMRPEILVIDEVVGAGDASFIEKTQKRMKEMMRSSRILVLSSHDTSIIDKMCDQVLWLEMGEVRYYGDKKEGIQAYMDSLNVPAVQG